ncbi:hypothetical protein D2V93_16560 [Flagellimonas taeanensis]|uniref:hypothetical protein n=1 Tax=Flavobacteriaceae TaxID=49546 RepID=UPI000E67911C|nr:MULTISPECIES: hypothetical protein [Allomuricauda]MDC6384002.1 hypothetical protein [Muricauda sp. SK9]MEE1962076.1 hypothetical protein [Allomuricauda taeanensis]RIV48611.1 hypothetical protein D2V93_16560 [Allomuricauda taeanensis]
MEATKKHRTSRFIQVGCTLLCTFYVFGIFNGLFLEGLHEVSHFWGPKTHQHSFFAGHEAVDYSSLEAMAGHSHEALEVLKTLLEANQPDDQQSTDDIQLQLDKHFVDEVGVVFQMFPIAIANEHWVRPNSFFSWSQGVTTPPPQHY